MTLTREELILQDAYRKVPQAVVDDLLIAGLGAEAHVAPGYLACIARIVMKQRIARRQEKERKSDV